MATRDLVPRADGEGGIGKVAKAWLSGFFKSFIKIEDRYVRTIEGIAVYTSSFTPGITQAEDNFLNIIDTTGVDFSVEVTLPESQDTYVGHRFSLRNGSATKTVVVIVPTGVYLDDQTEVTLYLPPLTTWEFCAALTTDGINNGWVTKSFSQPSVGLPAKSLPVVFWPHVTSILGGGGLSMVGQNAIHLPEGMIAIVNVPGEATYHYKVETSGDDNDGVLFIRSNDYGDSGKGFRLI